MYNINPVANNLFRLICGGMSSVLDIMTTLILYGEIKDKSVTSKLCRVLSDYGGVLYFSDSKAIKYGMFDHISFVVLECDKLCEISIPNCIVIFKSKQSSSCHIKLCSSAISIVESSNKKAIRAISGNQNPCISCGMSSNDTITLSSISDTDATISIQRSINEINNASIEPCDVTVKLKNFCDGYTLLSTFCALTLSGYMENGYLKM